MPDEPSHPDSGQSDHPIVNITGERVALGPARRDLIPLYQRWINDFETLRNLGQAPMPMTLDAETTWYEETAKSGNPFFTIYELPSWRPIGTTALHDVDHRHGLAEFGILIGEPEARGKGLGAEVTRLMADYAFSVLGLHNVMLRVFAFNAGAIRAYEKAGFREIGRRRSATAMGGRRWDIVYMDCVPDDLQGASRFPAFQSPEPPPDDMA